MPADAQTEKSTRSAWRGVVLRVPIAVILLVVAVRAALPDQDADLLDVLRGAWQSSAAIAWLWAGVAFLLFALNLAVGAKRFQLMLRGAGLEARWLPLFRAYLVATFFNTVLPGGVMGDVYRVWDARVDGGRGSAIFGVVVLERLLGLSALGCLALVAAPLILANPETSTLATRLIAFSILLVVTPLIALLPVSARILQRLSTRLHGLPGRIVERIENALEAVAELRRQPRLVLISFALSMLCQWLPVGAVYALSIPLATDVPWYWYAAIVPFVTLMSMLPVTIGGTGIREYLFVALFGAVGMAPGVALALSLCILALTLVWAGIGLATFAMGAQAASVGQHVVAEGAAAPRRTLRAKEVGGGEDPALVELGDLVVGQVGDRQHVPGEAPLLEIAPHGARSCAAAAGAERRRRPGRRFRPHRPWPCRRGSGRRRGCRGSTYRARPRSWWRSSAPPAPRSGLAGRG